MLRAIISIAMFYGTFAGECYRQNDLDKTNLRWAFKTSDKTRMVCLILNFGDKKKIEVRGGDGGVQK
jgi:hypothetical protein